MIQVTDTIAIPEDEIEESFVRSSGPGGQHANVTASRIEVSFDVNASEALSADQKRRTGKGAEHLQAKMQ